jgi:hypothetical protein
MAPLVFAMSEKFSLSTFDMARLFYSSRNFCTGTAAVLFEFVIGAEVRFKDLFALWRIFCEPPPLLFLYELDDLDGLSTLYLLY